MTMKFKLLLIVAVVFLSPTLNAENNPQWVIGSFVSKINAENEVERIQRMVGLDSHLVGAIANGEEVFRLVTQKPESASDQEQTRAALAAIGIQGVWNLFLDVGDLTMIDKSRADDQEAQLQAPPAPAAAPPAPAPAAPLETFAPKTVSSELPFAPDNRSYADFCINKATAAQRKQYCGNQEFAARTREELSRYTDADAKYRKLMDYCIKQATPDERKRKCGNAGLTAASSN